MKKKKKSSACLASKQVFWRARWASHTEKPGLSTADLWHTVKKNTGLQWLPKFARSEEAASLHWNIVCLCGNGIMTRKSTRHTWKVQASTQLMWASCMEGIGKAKVNKLLRMGPRHWKKPLNLPDAAQTQACYLQRLVLRERDGGFEK